MATSVTECDRLWVPRPDEIYRINVGGSRTLLPSAAEAGYRFRQKGYLT